MADEIDALVGELYANFGSLQEQGLLDEQFITNYEMKPDDGSMFFIELIQMFHEDIRSAMRDLAHSLERPAVNYTEINEHYAKIESIVKSVGASVLNLPLEVLRLGVAASSKPECDFALLRIHQEYHRLRPHVESITEPLPIFYAIENYSAETMKGFPEDLRNLLTSSLLRLERRIVDLGQKLAGPGGK